MELKHVNKQPLSTERTESRHQTDSPGTGLTPSREERNAGRGSGTRRLVVSKEARGASTKWQEMLPAAQQCWNMNKSPLFENTVFSRIMLNYPPC